MYKYLFVGCFLFSLLGVAAQEINPSAPSLPDSKPLELSNIQSDSLSSPKDSIPSKNRFVALEEKEVEVIDSATIDMYLIERWKNPTQIIDTTLTIQKEYRNNFLRRDYFELLPFVNMGHAFNRLGYDFSTRNSSPQIGAKSKHYGYLDTEQINYYHVPTPITELFFKSTMEQGQLSDAVISFNTSPAFNMAIAYRGMRSLGKYINQRSAAEALRISFNYKSDNKRYFAKFHYVSQSIDNQENGGLNAENETLFTTGDPDFIERSVLDVRLENAESFLKGKRSFLAHEYALVTSETGTTQWKLNHEFVNESKRYTYQDNTSSEYFGPRVYNIGIDDKTRWAILKNRVGTTLSNATLGKLAAGITYSQIDYFFEPPEGIPEETFPLALDVNQSFLDVNYDFNWKGFSFTGFFNKTITGEQLSDEISLVGSIRLKKGLSFNAKAAFINRSPDMNFVRYRSNYLYYNWYNESLSNEKITHLSANLSHTKWGALSAQLQKLDHYTFYNQLTLLPDSETQITPDLMLMQVVQASQPITYFKLRYDAHYSLGKFALTTSAQYQQVQSDEITSEDQRLQIINVPEWNLRSTLSFSSDVFNKAMYLQVGVTGQYFSAFYADAYNPLLGDFMRQDHTLVGDYPRLDVFVNARIQRTRIYLKYEHANATLTGYNYFSAPSYPYRDALLRLGLVWNFFE